MLNVTHHNAAVNGIQMHYAEQGEGPLVVLLHGFPEFWYSWKAQIPELAKHFRVVAPDLRGYGQSSKPKKVSAYKTETLALDIAALIKELSEEKAFIVGHDWGGAIAWQMTQTCPEVMQKLVVLNCPYGEIMQKHLRSNWKQMKRSWYVYFFQLPYFPEKRMSGNTKKFFKVALRGWAHNKGAFPNEVIDKYVEQFPDFASFRGPINYYRAAFRSTLGRPRHKQIETDTLMIWGEDDKALGKELTYGTEKYFSAKFDIEYIPDCSHWVQHDHPERVNQLIINYLKQDT